MQNNSLSQIDEDLYYILLEDFNLPALDFQQAQHIAQSNNVPFWSYWLKQWHLAEADFLKYFIAYIECQSLDQQTINTSAIIMFAQHDKYKHLLNNHIIPMAEHDHTLTVLIALPQHFMFLNAYQKINPQPLSIQVITLTHYWQLHYSILADQYIREAFNAKSDAIISKLIDAILKKALADNVSDVHGDPNQQAITLRFRKNGLLYDAYQLPASLAKQITNRLKLISQCDVANTRQPQDGYLKIKDYFKGNQDARIHICPTIFGEKWAIRLLPQKRIQSLEDIYLSTQQQHIVRKQIHQPQGLILITGPTGSGKTTTLYTLLNTLNTKQLNISTIEDPVEKQIDGFNQIQINHSVGLNFPTGLKALLRQDPDIIMVGELRDQATAEIALKAAQTGHLVFATLHSNSTAHTISRLLAMGFQPELLSQTIHLIIAQRLIRTLCKTCKKQSPCHICQNGYQHRIPIYEIMEMSSKLQVIIESNPFNVNTLHQVAIEQGMSTLERSAQFLVDKGITDQQEVTRVLIQ